jgi:hypothetical protein
VVPPKAEIILDLDERSARKDNDDKERVKFLRGLARNQDKGSLIICYLFLDADDMGEYDTMRLDYGCVYRELHPY